MIKWSENLAIGIEMVDSHHRRIMELISHLQSTLHVNVADRNLVEITLDSLVEHCRAHFAEEESLMEFCGIDPGHVREHTLEHRAFIDVIVRLVAEIEVATSRQVNETLKDLVRYMTAWLMLHIVSMDQAMACQIRAVESGGTATEALHNLQHDQPASSGSRAILSCVLDLWRDALDQCRKLEARLAALAPCPSPGEPLPQWPMLESRRAPSRILTQSCARAAFD